MTPFLRVASGAKIVRREGSVQVSNVILTEPLEGVRGWGATQGNLTELKVFCYTHF
jgi:hypothetical protein